MRKIRKSKPQANPEVIGFSLKTFKEVLEKVKAEQAKLLQEK
jgi:hypothetical protein